jgi:hypothetical protein
MKQNKSLLIIMGVLLIGLLSITWNLSADVTLAVPETFQQYSNWCWAGATEAALDYYGQYPSQCEIANFTWSSTRCCSGSTDFYDRVKGCNKANWFYGTDGSVEGIMNNWGVSTTTTEDILTWNECVTELDNGQPFLFRFGWTNGGGHFLVGYGYITTGSYIKYMDPWPGEGYMTSLYTFVVSSADHDWTHSMKTY